MPGMRPLAWVLGLTALVLAGCSTQDATGSGASAAIEGGAGLSGPDDGASALPQVDGGTTDDGRRTTPPIADDRRRRDRRLRSGRLGPEARDLQSVVQRSGDRRRVLDPVGATRMLALDGAGNMYVAAAFIGSVTVAGQAFQSARDREPAPGQGDPACRVLWAKAFGASQAGV